MSYLLNLLLRKSLLISLHTNEFSKTLYLNLVSPKISQSSSDSVSVFALYLVFLKKFTTKLTILLKLSIIFGRKIQKYQRFIFNYVKKISNIYCHYR
jgi:hypothetical protein